jgi:tol-pal system beta propeller repeat protein TolB
MGINRTGRIVFSSGKRMDYDIWMLDLDSDRLVQLTHGKYWNDKPRWCPDGEWVVYVSNARGTPDIYKVPVNGGQPVPLVEDDRWNDFPAFSPDGTRLGYVSNVSGNNDLWIADADGQNARQVTQYDGDDTSFAWMPDGKSVLFSSDRGGSSDIWQIDLQSGEKRQLTTDEGMDICPAPSPDGTLIAFVSNRQDNPEACSDKWKDRDQDIWMMTARGEHKVRITSSQQSDRSVAWSPDGQGLIYAGSTGRSSERLRLIDVSDLVAAYKTDDASAIEHAADKLRSMPLDLDRKPLEREINAQRKTCLFTSLLPDFLITPMYGADFFGCERFPDWIATPVSAGTTATAAGSARAE